MSTLHTRSLDGRLYRVALSLCPAGFRRDHGDEMARDFDEARHEAVSDGARALWGLRCLMAVDLVRTMTRQWIRTGLPVIAAASVALALGLAAALATLARNARVELPEVLKDEEALIVLFMAVLLVMLIATTIILSQWVGRLTRQRRPPVDVHRGVRRR